MKKDLETVDVIFELESARALYKRYFKFERRREFKKIPSKLLFGFSAIMILVGIFTELGILWVLGLISTFLIGIFLLYYFVRFEIAFNKFSKELEKKAKSPDRNYQFSFNSETIVYKSENMNSEIKWKMIKAYQLNGKDLYLYLENQELLDIVFEKALGVDKFEKFKNVLKEKIKPESNQNQL